MKAVRIRSLGGPEVVILDDVPRPHPGVDQVLVRVRAAGVGPWDAWIRAGTGAFPHATPLTLGSDLSGLVEDIGDGVTGLSIGDEVFGVANDHFEDAWAEFVAASAGRVALKPRRATFEEAASLPVVAVTAWQALFEEGGLQRGGTVLVHGAAGSVGALAVQLAHRAGARVVATCSKADVGFVRGLGADVVVDHRAARFESAAAEVDVVLDTVGGEVQSRSFTVLRKGGTLVSIVSRPESGRPDVRAVFFLVDVTRARLERIAALVDEGALQPDVGTVLPLADARQAHEMLDGGRPHPRGKIVLRVG